MSEKKILSGTTSGLLRFWNVDRSKKLQFEIMADTSLSIKHSDNTNGLHIKKFNIIPMHPNLVRKYIHR
jgi:hypothetical protein